MTKNHWVTAQFDQLRAIRFQDAVNRTAARRKCKQVINSKSLDTSKPIDLEHREINLLIRVLQQELLDDETRACCSAYYFTIQEELTSLQETETKMVEMCAFESPHVHVHTYVLQQAQQIENTSMSRSSLSCCCHVIN